MECNDLQLQGQGKKVIFLDVDGVLHSIRVTRQEQLFNPQKMALLRKLISNTDAQVGLVGFVEESRGVQLGLM